MTRASIAGGLLLMLAACSPWVLIDPENARLKEHDYEVSLPEGWVRPMFQHDEVVLTRDGLPLEQIMVRQRPNKKAFPRLKKPASDKLLPSELAELQIAETKREGELMANLEVLENEPATVAGKQGFRVRLRFVTERALPIEQLLYGVCDEKYYYLLGLQAPEFYYFEKHRAEFEKMVASFKIG
jgi:photosystem II reaction center protein PsbP